MCFLKEFLKQNVQYFNRIRQLACHTSKETMDFLKDNGIEPLPWIPNGADMNIIEDIWSDI